MTEEKGTKAHPWELKTPSGTSEYTMYRDETHNPPILVRSSGAFEMLPGIRKNQQEQASSL